MADREKLIELINKSGACFYCFPMGNLGEEQAEKIADHLIANGVVVLPLGGIGEMSDGYHTFNELYHHRAVLFSVICNARPDLAWKSKLHDTGDMYEGMFIVGIETKEGQATYHYDIDPYWDMFNVPVLDRAPVWDGHTPQQAIDRIANGVVISNSETTTKWIPVTGRLPQEDEPLGATCEQVQVLLADGTVTTGWCNRFRKLWYHLPWGDTHFYAYPYEHTPVIAWQPLAEPPKGE